MIISLKDKEKDKILGKKYRYCKKIARVLLVIPQCTL